MGVCIFCFPFLWWNILRKILVLPAVLTSCLNGFCVFLSALTVVRILAADFLFHFSQVSAWGGYVFIINLIPLHVFVLLLMQRYSRRVYIGKFCSLNSHCQVLDHEIWNYTDVFCIRWELSNCTSNCISLIELLIIVSCCLQQKRVKTSCSHFQNFRSTAANSFSTFWCTEKKKQLDSLIFLKSC